MTPVQRVYDRFFSMISDENFLEIDFEEVQEQCMSYLLSSIPTFEFPKVPFTFKTEIVRNEEIIYLEQDLTLEEINILAMGMVLAWLQPEIAAIRLIQQRASGADFKFSSQASHLQRLLGAQQNMRDEHRRLQLLHSRRRVNEKGEYESALDLLIKT